MLIPKVMACIFFCWSAGRAQSVLGVSSASGVVGSTVTLNIALNTAYPGSSAGLQWTLNAPRDEVESITMSPGPAALAAQSSLYCSNNTCLLIGLNLTPLGNGVVAVATLKLASIASGDLVIQLSGPAEALLDGTSGSITATSGLVHVMPHVSPNVPRR